MNLLLRMDRGHTMTEKICTLLNLNATAGLGRRLVASKIRQDNCNPHLFILANEDMVEAFNLARALSVQSQKVLKLNLHFKAANYTV